MKIKYDLHIHSKLSPCSSELMTPNNIMNMCMLKGLNLIAITDHNSILQLDTLQKISESYDFLFINGIEITTIEGYHILAYFDGLETIKDFYFSIFKFYDTNCKSINPKSQILFDEYDQEIGYISYDLHQRIKVNTYDLINLVRKFNGIIVLAHIDRHNTGILDSNIDLRIIDFDGFEVDDKSKLPYIYKKYPLLIKKRLFYNSDSHDIININEEQILEIPELSFEGLKACMKHE